MDKKKTPKDYILLTSLSGTIIADFKTDGKYFFTKFTVFAKY